MGAVSAGVVAQGVLLPCCGVGTGTHMRSGLVEASRATADRLVPRWLSRAAIACLCVLAIGATAWWVARVLASLMTVTAAVVAAVLLTALVRPLADLLVRWRAPTWLAALATVLATLALLVGTVVLLVSRARDQLVDLQAAVTDGVEGLRQALLDSPLPLSEARLADGQEQLTGALVSLLPSPATGAGLATEGLSAAALAIFLWFFMLKDGASMWGWAVGWAPRARREAVDRGGREVWDVMTSYVRGTTVVAAADAVGIGLGMVLLGVPLWASLTLIVFFGAFIPIVGSFVSGALAAGVTLVTVGPVAALVLVGVVILVQQIEGNLLQPLIMGRALHLHPAGIVLAVAVGALAAGVLGAVIAVPLVAGALRLAEQAREGRAGPASDSTAAP